MRHIHRPSPDTIPVLQSPVRCASVAKTLKERDMKKAKVLHCRVTQEQHQAVYQAAKAAGVSMTQYVLSVVLKAAKDAEAQHVLAIIKAAKDAE